MSLLSWFRRKSRPRGNPAHGIIEVEDELVRVILGHEAIEMRWSDVIRIEVGRKPTATVEIFYSYLFDNTDGEIYADDLMVRFDKFQAAVLARWPEVKSSWLVIFNGPPDKNEHVQVWKR